MRILELDMENGSLKDTPARVAKMYVIEAEHLCIASRGISDAGSATITGSHHGRLAAEKKMSCCNY